MSTTESITVQEALSSSPWAGANARTHTLHDPVAYKRREVGVYALLNELPEPTWYT